MENNFWTDQTVAEYAARFMTDVVIVVEEIIEGKQPHKIISAGEFRLLRHKNAFVKAEDVYTTHCLSVKEIIEETKRVGYTALPDYEKLLIGLVEKKM